MEAEIIFSKLPHRHILFLRKKAFLWNTNSNLFAYAANNPVRYIDPDGNANFLSNFINIISLLCSSQTLGKSEPTTSLYQQQYRNMNDELNDSLMTVNFLSVIPGEIGVAASLAGLIGSLEGADEALVNVSERLQFINGAENEINLLDGLIESTNDKDYKSFLKEQKNKLKSEIAKNSEADSKLGFTSVCGGKVEDPRDTIATKPSVDYEQAFKDYKKRNLDE